MAAFEVHVISYAEKHGNRANESVQCFWSSQAILTKDLLINTKTSSCMLWLMFWWWMDGKYPELEKNLSYVHEFKKRAGREKF